MAINGFNTIRDLNELDNFQDQFPDPALGDPNFFGGPAPPGDELAPLRSPSVLSWMDNTHDHEDPNLLDDNDEHDDELDAEYEIDAFYDRDRVEHQEQQHIAAAAAREAAVTTPHADEDGEKPFRCENNACDCGQAYSRAAQLTRHVAYATSQFACDYCLRDNEGERKRFGSRNDLGRHLREVHGGGKEYPCPDPTCDRHTRPFRRLKNQEGHVEKRHPGLLQGLQALETSRSATQTRDLENASAAGQQQTTASTVPRTASTGTNPAVPPRGTKRPSEATEPSCPPSGGPSARPAGPQDPNELFLLSELQQARNRRETRELRTQSLMTEIQELTGGIREDEQTERILEQQLARWREHQMRANGAY